MTSYLALFSCPFFLVFSALFPCSFFSFVFSVCLFSGEIDMIGCPCIHRISLDCEKEKCYLFINVCVCVSGEGGGVGWLTG